MFSNWNILIWEYDFLSPQWLWGLLFVPLFLYWMFRIERNRDGEIKFSRIEEDQENLESKWIPQVRILIVLLYSFVIVLLIFALAKPVKWNSPENIKEEYKNGIDIILALDISTSMLARDFEPDRLEASKEIAKKFIDGRRGDRIGLVVYAGEAYTACPATLDYEILKNQIDEIRIGAIEDGTAIGTGLGTAVTRLRSDSLKSKVIILMTDGMNNAGDISPEAASELAKAKNIRVYTIGVGTNGQALMPVPTVFGINYQYMPVLIDEIKLTNIAQKTGGKYFRATNKESLSNIYQEIEKLEKRKILDKHYKSEPPSNPIAFFNWAFLLSILTWTTKTILFKTNE